MIPQLNPEQLLAVHPSWLANRSSWQLVQQLRAQEQNVRVLLEARKGPLERAPEFNHRVSLTEWSPEAPIARNRLSASLFSLSVDRNAVLEDTDISPWAMSVDLCGRTWPTFFEELAVPLALDFGAAFITVDTPRSNTPALSRHEEEEAGLHSPLLNAWDPLHVRNWSISPEGELEWISIVQDTWVSPEPYSPRVRQREVRVFDKDSLALFVLRTKEGKEQKPLSWDPSGKPEGNADQYTLFSTEIRPHSFESTPVVPMVLDPVSACVGRSTMLPAYRLDLKRLVAESDHTYAVHMHAHPHLGVWSKEKPTEIGMGTDAFIHFDPDQDAPEKAEYITPPLDSYQPRVDLIKQCVTDSYRLIGLKPPTTSGEPDTLSQSGVAIAWDFSTREGRDIIRIAGRVQQSENSVLALVRQLLSPNSASEAGVRWPEEIDPQTNQERSSSLMSLSRHTRSETASRIAERRAVTLLLPDLDADESRAIETEIDSAPAHFSLTAFQQPDDPEPADFND